LQFENIATFLLGDADDACGRGLELGESVSVVKSLFFRSVWDGGIFGSSFAKFSLQGTAVNP
jgi:hypothetical protein